MHLNLALLPQSRFLPVKVGGADRKIVVMVAAGEYREQPIVVGWGIGERRPDGELMATDICQIVMDRVVALTEPETPLHILPLTKHASAKANLRKYLEANRPSALVILCADSDMCDAVSRALKPDWRMQ